ncbi:MAG: spore maturation protein A [Oscillospiraceae bacterium]|nr:spore maturation protein A [Oscillospiraceae bacterium]
MIILGVICGIIKGNISAVSESVLSEGVNAVELAIYMLGGMCVWGGIMRIAQKSGLCEKLCTLFRPVCRLLFKGLNPKGEAFSAITLNITANLLGLGNAATPFGIKAMQEIEKEEKTDTKASNNMITFTVLNTASITLIPTTACMLRMKHNSENPFEIIPVVMLASASILILTLTVTLIVNKIRGDK